MRRLRARQAAVRIIPGRVYIHQVLASQLEAFVTARYRDVSWKEQLALLPDQKVIGVAGWLAVLGDYLNKVGHHRDREAREPAGDLAVRLFVIERGWVVGGRAGFRRR